MKKWHAERLMLGMVRSTLDLIYSGWKDSLIGVVMNERRNPSGWFSSLLKLFENEIGTNIIRVCCDAQQLSLLIIDQCVRKLLQNDLYYVFTAIIGSLRK